MTNTTLRAAPTRRVFVFSALTTFAALALGAAATLAPLGQASAQDYPTGPITLIVPFPPGGPTDVSARLVGKSLGTLLGKPVIVENRPGAGGTVGSAFVARAPADGYTLLWGSTSSLGVAPSLYPNPGYAPMTSFAPIGMVGRTPILLVTRSALPPKTLQEFVAYAKTNKSSYGSAGNGSINHLTGEWLKEVAKFDMLHVPYKGGAPAFADMVSGQVDMSLETITLAQPYMANGRIKVLATTSAKRSPAMPDVPTVQEIYGNDFEVYSWLALVAPAKTPPAVLQKLNDALRGAQNDPELRKQMETGGLEVIQTTPDEFRTFLAGESKKWTALVAKTKPVVD
jgi:tripartite-type tricarboxylate transporter receptor subunit TctC